MEKMLINNLVILGVGLIGGSLARTLRRAGACGTITGFGRSEENLNRAVELGVIDHYSLDAEQAVRDADVVVLAAPLATTETLLIHVKNGLKSGAVITDVGSAKGSIVAAARSILTRDQMQAFVPGPVQFFSDQGIFPA